VTAGGTALAVQQGLISDQALADAAQYWPVILIAVGVAVAFGSSMLGTAGTVVAGLALGILIGSAITVGPRIGIGCSGDEPGAAQVIDSGSFSQATVDVEFNCGKLEVNTAYQDGWEVAAAGDNLDEIAVTADAHSLSVKNSSTEGGFFTVGQKQRLAVTLPGGSYDLLRIQVNAAESVFHLADVDRATAFDQIDIAANAGAIDLDLTGTRADDVAFTLNAGAASISVDEFTHIGSGAPGSLTIAVNAGSVELCAPDNLGLRIVVTANLTFSHNLADAGLVQDGETWQTPDFDQQEAQLVIDLSGNAASFTLNPEGGCR
jgi:hypothetical protein